MNKGRYKDMKGCVCFTILSVAMPGYRKQRYLKQPDWICAEQGGKISAPQFVPQRLDSCNQECSRKDTKHILL